MEHERARSKPQSVKNFTLAFFIVALVMVGAQVTNLVITFLPSAAQTLIQVDGETTMTVASLRNAYISSVILVALIYGLVWVALWRTNNWARWVAVILSVLTVAGGVQGVTQRLTSGTFDMVGLALSLAQLLAAGWVLSLAFRRDVKEWFKHKGIPEQQ